MSTSPETLERHLLPDDNWHPVTGIAEDAEFEQGQPVDLLVSRKSYTVVPAQADPANDILLTFTPEHLRREEYEVTATGLVEADGLFEDVIIYGPMSSLRIKRAKNATLFAVPDFPPEQ